MASYACVVETEGRPEAGMTRPGKERRVCSRAGWRMHAEESKSRAGTCPE